MFFKPGGRDPVGRATAIIFARLLLIIIFARLLLTKIKSTAIIFYAAEARAKVLLSVIFKIALYFFMIFDFSSRRNQQVCTRLLLHVVLLDCQKELQLLTLMSLLLMQVLL